MIVDRLCWGAWGIRRPKLERCDAHRHRPRRADWRAKAYERSARWTCARALFDAWFWGEDRRRLPPHGDGPRCTLDVARLHEAQQLAYTGACR